MSLDRDAVRSTVSRIVAEALDQPEAAVGGHASLIDDLGAESIDFLDIQFRLEHAFDFRVDEGELWRGRLDFDDPRWVVDERLTPDGIAALRELLPDYPWQRFPAGLTLGDLPRLISVDSITEQVQRVLSAGEGGGLA